MTKGDTRAVLAWRVAAIAMLSCAALASPACAEVCGDADGSGVVTVTDGVQTLRAAAGLSTSCVAGRCDLDGNGTVSVTDGVNTLRVAAGLPVTLSCPSACGNGVVDPGEQCDTKNLGGATCESLGLHPGTLHCKPDCTFRTVRCSSLEDFCAAFSERPSDPPDCGGPLPPGFVCAKLSNASPTYWWAVEDEPGPLGPNEFLGPCDGHFVTTIVGKKHWYMHQGGTILVRID